jgi:hypothetical protein
MTAKAEGSGWTVEVVHLDCTSKATGPVTGCRPLGDGWQLLLKRHRLTVAFCMPADAIKWGVPVSLVREVTEALRATLAAEEAKS